MLGAGWASCDESYGANDEQNAGPAGEAEVLVEPEAAEERDDHVAEGSGGHDEGEIGPGERRHVAGEEADEERDSGDDVGIAQGVEEKAQVVKVDGPDLRHATGEEGISDGGSEHDGKQDGVLGGSKAVCHLGGNAALGDMPPIQDTKRNR